MDTIKTLGLIVKQVNFDESDCIFQIFTQTHGLISAMGKGARKNKSPLFTCRYLAYGEFVLFQGTKFYHINGFNMEENFYDLSADLNKLSLAAYITDVLLTAAKQEQCDGNLLSLTLNSLYMLDKSDKPLKIIKTVFEWCAASAGGFMPRLHECAYCEEKINGSGEEKMYFSIESGSIVCQKCGRGKGIMPISSPVYAALCYILNSSLKRAFSFALEEMYLEQINDISERYLQYHFDKKFNSLDFLKSMLL